MAPQSTAVSPASKNRGSLSKTFFMISLFHAVYASTIFLGMVVTFSMFGGEMIRFAARYRSNISDARSAFNPVILLAGSAVLVTCALWDYCALGAVLAASEHQNYGTVLRRPYSIFWCCRNVGANERLTESCHGYCDNSCGRLLTIAIRMGVVSAMMTIAIKTAVNGFTMDVPAGENRMYFIAVAIGVAMLIEWPLTIAGTIFHSIFTYHWVRNWHRIEVMALELSNLDDSISLSSHEMD